MSGRRAGYTLLEVILSLTITVMIVSMVTAMFVMMRETDRELTYKYEDLSEMGRVHTTVRRALQRLVAAEPESDLLGAPPPPARTAGAPATGGAPLEDDTGDERSIGERVGFEEEEKAPMHFILEASSLAASRGLVADDQAPRRLEVVLTDPPLAGSPRGPGSVRGAFEPAPTGFRTWALQWRPIEPPGAPIVLIDDVVLLEWSALGSDQESESGNPWFGLYEAREERHMPRAVRLVLMTADGTVADWLFEPGVTIGESP